MGRQGVLRCVLLALLAGAACDATFDRADESVATATDRLEAATSRAVAAAGAELRATAAAAVQDATERLAAVPAAAVQSAADAIRVQADAAASRITASVSGRLAPEDRAAFEAKRKESGLLAALREFWVELVLGGAASGGLLRSWIDRRRAARSKKREQELEAAVRAVLDSLGSADADGDGSASPDERQRWIDRALDAVRKTGVSDNAALEVVRRYALRDRA